MGKNDYIDILSSKFLSGNISPDEKKELDARLGSSPGTKKILNKNKKAWELGAGLISMEDIKQDKNRVFDKIQKQQSVLFLRARRQLMIYKIAALLAIPVTFALSWYLMQGNVEAVEGSQFCEVTAPKGHVAKCILPDSTRVWVNTGSTLTYNTASFNQHAREVQISGEAYFEVTKNKAKPFKVATPAANIYVTGTSFNIKAYPAGNTFETILAEGSIEMELNKSHQKVPLSPGERAVYLEDKNKISIEKVEADFFTSWRNGEILFKDATLNDLVEELERIYDIRFHIINPKLGGVRFRGMFSYNNNLIEALEKIKRTANINYRIENKEVWLMGTLDN